MHPSALLCLFTLQTPPPPPTTVQSHPLWGELTPGPHPVGFVSSWRLDSARLWKMTFADGSRYADEPAPRPILVNVWYPAELDDGEPMLERDYFDLPSDDERVARFARALVEYDRGVLAQELFAKGEKSFTEPERKLFEEFLDTESACLRDATPTTTRWPLVIYHSGYGSSYDDNSVLCEFLASRGYVVAGSAFQTGDGSSFNIDAHEATARDIEFLVAELAQRPDVDASRVALIGHSGGAHAVMRQCVRPGSALTAAVSLDTTEDYYSTLDPRWNDMIQPVTAHRERMTAPLLMAANPHGFFQLADQLATVDRWYFTTYLDHNEFISQGVIRAELDARRAGAAETAATAAHAREVRANYAALCEFEALFLDAQVKGDAAAKAELATAWRDTRLGGKEPHVELAAKGATVAAPYPLESARPPTPRELRPFLAEHGLAATLALLRRFAAAEPRPPIFHPIFGFALVFELAERGDTESARALGCLYAELVPEVLGHFSAIASYGGRIGLRDFAASCWRAMLLVDPENADAKRGLAAK